MIIPYCRDLHIYWKSVTEVVVGYSDIYIEYYTKHNERDKSPVVVNLEQISASSDSRPAAKSLSLKDCSATLSNPGDFATMRMNAGEISEGQ
jgi:hypothetical protein